MILNNLIVFLNNACGSDCPTDGTNHLCDECYKITQFCEECEAHLETVLEMSNGIWLIVLACCILCGFLGFIFGSLERPIKNV